MNESACPPAPDADPTGPLTIQVVRGRPDDLEVAAVVAALLSVASSADPVPGGPLRGRWADPDRWQGGSARARVGVWRLAGLPR